MNSKIYFAPPHFHTAHYLDIINTCFMTCAKLIKYNLKRGYLFPFSRINL